MKKLLFAEKLYHLINQKIHLLTLPYETMTKKIAANSFVNQ